jgi:predicted alpha/beta hydrolase
MNVVYNFTTIISHQWDDDEVRFVPDQQTELDFYSASSLKHKSAGRHVVPLGHINLIQSQPVFTLSP